MVTISNSKITSSGINPKNGNPETNNPETNKSQTNESEIPFLRPVTSEEFIPPTNRWISITGFVLTGTMAIAVSMAATIKYNVTVKAAGTVRPAGELRLVQPEIEGTVKSILVKENQSVRKGQIIAQLDDTQQKIRKSQLEGNIQQTKLQIIQINGQIQSLGTQIAAEEQSITRAIAANRADLARNQREYEDRKVTTQSELLASEAQLQQQKANLQKAHANLEFAQIEANRYKTLVKAGAISRSEFDKRLLTVKQNKSALLSVQKAVDIALARRKSAQTALNPTNATVAIAQQRILQEKSKGTATIATLKKEKLQLIQRRMEIENQLQQTQKELQQTNRQSQKNTIRATSDGVILQLNLRNSGQVIRPGDGIAQIIPQNSPLIIKTIINGSDIKKVTVGQKVQLRVEACSYPDYGTLPGIVTAISPDAISPQNKNSGANTTQVSSGNNNFEATIKPQNLTFGRHSKQCRMQAGMKTQADIISREETPLQFLLRKARLITDL